MDFEYDPILGRMRKKDSAGVSFDKGYYATPAALTTALPVGQAGWFCNIGTTDTVWIWDAETTAWIDSGAKYSLPVASASVLGGVKQGSGVNIAGDGTLSASSGGSDTVVKILSSATWTVPAGVTVLKDVYIFGGGGAAGGGGATGGGGAGGMIHLSNYVVTPLASIAAVIGAGGAGATSGDGGTGGNTSFGSIVVCGGAGGVINSTNRSNSGGCGSGGGTISPNYGIYPSIGWQGGNGGCQGWVAGGGGGGVCGTGMDGAPYGQHWGGFGGMGIYLGGLVGTELGYAGWFGCGGGGGACYVTSDGEEGGKGGMGIAGANGGKFSSPDGADAIANSACGGGGSTQNGGGGAKAGNGGSGIIIIRY